MEFPAMGKSKHYTVNVPELKGGLNLHDAPNMVDDDQLTDCLNMWWKDGALRTRPGFQYSPGMQIPQSKGNLYRTSYHDWIGDYHIYIDFYRGSSSACSYGNDGVWDASKINETVTFDRTSCSMMLTDCGRTPALSKSGLAGFYYDGREPNIVTFEKGHTNWSSVSYAYEPTVMISGRGVETNMLGNYESDGYMIEGFNMLTSKFRCQFTTDGKSTMFKLPTSELDNMEVTVRLIELTGNIIDWEIPAGRSFSSEEHLINDTYSAVVYLNRATGNITFMKSGNGEAMQIAPNPSIKNNLRVRAGISNTAQKQKICSMRFCTWFGGDRSGLNGGTRLFVSGNPNFPNLVHWSGIDDLLYFPENNYAYVGSANQRVTAFGKQGNILVIFKENEMYYAEYVASENITAEDVMNNKVVDVSSNMARFPITPINSKIGCDCPGTIKLCNNRLIWATSDGHVYSLMGTNQYSERNVRSIAENIAPALSKHSPSELKEARSCDCGGRYFLLVGSEIYVLDYMDSAFQYFSSYNDDRKAAKNMPWHIWDVSIPGVKWIDIVSDGTKMFLLSNELYNKNEYFVNYLLDGVSDNVFSQGRSLSVKSYAQTKSFDFGRPDFKKKINQLYIGENNGGIIGLSYVSDGYERPDLIVKSHNGIIRVTPNICGVRQLGLKIETDTPLALTGMMIKYSLLGAAK